MKNSILLVLVLLACSVIDVRSADYDGATKYPSTTLVSGQFTLVVAGVVQTKTFSQLHTAMSTAVVISQRCSCEVIIKSPDVRVNTKWKPVLATDAPITLGWLRPTEREGGEPLLASELKDYSVIRKNSAGVTLNVMSIPAENLDSIQYTATMTYSPTDEFLVLATDTNGLSSAPALLNPYVGNL